jgi:hypothetical protein
VTADTYTKNFKFVKPAFNKKPWQQNLWDTLDSLDAVLNRWIALSNFQGPWATGTAYTVGQRVVDVDLGLMYQCAIAHTSPTSGSFSAARLASPALWTAFSFQLNFRGTWVAGTSYGAGDFVVSGQRFAVAQSAHTSSALFMTDVNNGLWSVIIDATQLAPFPSGLSTNNNQLVRYDSAAQQFQFCTNATLTTAGLLTVANLTTAVGSTITFGNTSAMSFGTGTTFTYGDAAAVTNHVTALRATQAQVDAGTLAGVVTPDRLVGRLEHGGCQLGLSGGNLLLVPKQAGLLYIPGTGYMKVPAAGITLAVGTAKTEGGAPGASALHYIYAYNNAGTLTLQASTTGHSTDATTGVEIRTGDSTRVLVGMARTTAGTAWADTNTQRFVASYFNRRPKCLNLSITTVSGFSTSGASAEIGGCRLEYLSWADTDVSFRYYADISTSGAPGMIAYLSIGINTGSPGSIGNLGQVISVAGTSYHNSNGVAYATAEGYGFVAPVGITTNAVSVSYAVIGEGMVFI